MPEKYLYQRLEDVEPRIFQGLSNVLKGELPELELSLRRILGYRLDEYQCHALFTVIGVVDWCVCSY